MYRILQCLECMYIYFRTCIKRSQLGQIKSGLLRQVIS